MKKGLLFVFFGLASLMANAQTISLTDSEAISFYETNYPACINGVQLDLNCFAASQGNSLNACVITEIDDLAAIANSSTQVTLTWTAGQNDNTKFDLQRSTSDNFSTELETFTLTASSQSYVDNSVQAGTQYFYRIRKVYVPLSQVANVSAEAGDKKATVSFDENGALSYMVKAYSNGNYSGISAIGQTSPIEISGLTGGIDYSFTITPENQCGLGVESLQTGIVTPFDLTSGLLGYFPFNGNANDESGNQNNGTVTGASLTTDRFGNSNSAYSFAFGNNIDVGAIALDSDFTISVWAKQTGSNFDDQIIIVGGNEAGHTLELNARRAGNGVFNIEVGEDDFLLSFIPNGDVWYNYILKRTGNVIEFYVNGELNFTESNVSTVTPIVSKIGSASDSEYFPGAIDDIKIFNRALTSHEIQTLINQE